MDFSRFRLPPKSLMTAVALLLGASFIMYGGLFSVDNAQAAPPDITNIHANDGMVYARETTEFYAELAATPASTAVYIWDFGDGESALGDAQNAAKRGRVEHLYDKAGNYSGKLTIIYPDNSTKERPMTVEVKAIRDASRTLWPFASITRYNGNGPYKTGDQVSFGAEGSKVGFAGAIWSPANTYEWWLTKPDGSEDGPAAIRWDTAPKGKGVKQYTLAAAGYYQIKLRVNEIYSSGGESIERYDEAAFVVNVAASAPSVTALPVYKVTLKVNKLGLPVTETAVTIPIDYPDSMNESVNIAGTVTGAMAPFNCILIFPNEKKVSAQDDDFIIQEYLGEPYGILNCGGRVTFNTVGKKHIYLTVVDSANRRVSDEVVVDVVNKLATYQRTVIEPVFNPAQSTSPLTTNFSEKSNKAMVVVIPATQLLPGEHSFVFAASASGGTPAGGDPLYSIEWSGAGKDTCKNKNECTYTFNAFGSYPITATISDSSVPPQSHARTLTIFIQQENAVPPPPPPADGTGTGGTGTGAGTGTGTSGTGTGTGAGGTTGSSGTSTSADLYGLNSNFKAVALGQTSDAKGTMAKIINIVLGFLGILAVIIGLYGGFKMMTSGGNEDQTAAGRQAVIYAVIGLAVVFSAWIIAQFVISSLVKSIT